MTSLQSQTKTLVEQLNSQRLYAYRCREGANHLERLWWNGYIEALSHMLKLWRELGKEVKENDNR